MNCEPLKDGYYPHEALTSGTTRIFMTIKLQKPFYLFITTNNELISRCPVSADVAAHSCKNWEAANLTQLGAKLSQNAGRSLG